ncbi:MAG: hypothetical protein L6Q98_07295 [Anaerolineae bacterium]|nr:hypothetical protein [Anaerolineae bacterium]NUQ07232.1 hypothetical protein [Anaerolineae bacterium]
MFERTPLTGRPGAWLLLALLLIAAPPAAAQQGSGQLWVRAFIDRDGDGVRAPNEPLLTEGVAVELIREGVVIDSARLTPDSPYASQGLVGFQRLEPGEYTVRITTGALTPTTPDSVTVQVSGSGLPPVVEFGGQPPAEPVADEQDGILAFAPQDPEVMRLVVSALGALIVAGLVAGFGFLIYLLVLAPRYRAAQAQAKRAATTTGSMRAVMPRDAAGPSNSSR